MRERLEAALPHPVCTSQVTLWDHDTGQGATGVSHAQGGVSGISQHRGRDLGTTALCRQTGELPSHHCSAPGEHPGHWHLCWAVFFSRKAHFSVKSSYAAPSISHLTCCWPCWVVFQCEAHEGPMGGSHPTPPSQPSSSQLLTSRTCSQLCSSLPCSPPNRPDRTHPLQTSPFPLHFLQLVFKCIEPFPCVLQSLDCLPFPPVSQNSC